MRIPQRRRRPLPRHGCHAPYSRAVNPVNSGQSLSLQCSRGRTKAVVEVPDEKAALIDDLLEDYGMFADLGQALPAKLYEYPKAKSVAGATEGEPTT